MARLTKKEIDSAICSSKPNGLYLGSTKQAVGDDGPVQAKTERMSQIKRLHELGKSPEQIVGLVSRIESIEEIRGKPLSFFKIRGGSSRYKTWLHQFNDFLAYVCEILEIENDIDIEMDLNQHELALSENSMKIRCDGRVLHGPVAR